MSMAKSPRPESELRKTIISALEDDRFASIDSSLRATLAAEAVWRWAMKQTGDQSEKGKPWSDDALRAVLQSAPTHENIVRLARAFGRSPGSVEQIFRWAATSDKAVREKRPDDSFIQQIKRISKEVGWEAF
jgi:hypothetical protein